MAEVPAAALLSAEHALGEALLAAGTEADAFLDGMTAMAPALGWTAAALWLPSGGRPAVVAEWPGPRLGPWHEAEVVEAMRRTAPLWRGDRVWFGIESDDATAFVEARFDTVPDRTDALDATLLSTSRRVGHFVAQRRALRRARASEARARAISDAALDCIITIDREGCVVAANAALERIFGYDPVAVVGRELAELIVPPELRDAHRAGLARFAAGGEPRLLGRRVELEAVTATGARVPVELTVSAIDVPGRAAFTGFVRDISDRRLADAALRESRARVVTAADAARRRIERDLHDGAQQRLVALALTLRMADNRLAEDPAAARELLTEAREELDAATAELRELARGIHPAVLNDAGLETAVAGLARRAPIVVRADIEVPGRLPESVEAAAYYVMAEGITNAGRYSDADEVHVSAWLEEGVLRLRVRDEGRGGASLDGGSGLSGLADRLAAANGELSVHSPPGGGTTLEGAVPLLRFVR